MAFFYYTSPITIKMDSIEDFKDKLKQEIEDYQKATSKQCSSSDEINYHMKMFAETLCKKKQALGLTHVAIAETILPLRLVYSKYTIIVSNDNYLATIVHSSNSSKRFGKDFINFIPKDFVPLYIQFT
jgi:hypothetical protein